LMLLLSLAACGSADTPSDEGTPSGDNGASTSDQKDKTDDAGGEKIKLSGTQLGYNDDQIAAAEAKEEGLTPHDEYYIAVRKTIEEEYPNYEVEYLDWGWAETLDQKQRAAITAGDPPSVVAGETFMPTYA